MMVHAGKYIVEDPGESSSGTTGAPATQETGDRAEHRRALEEQKRLLLDQIEVQRLQEELRLLK
jgi:hypothetical protein